MDCALCRAATSASSTVHPVSPVVSPLPLGVRETLFCPGQPGLHCRQAKRAHAATAQKPPPLHFLSNSGTPPGQQANTHPPPRPVGALPRKQAEFNPKLYFNASSNNVLSLANTDALLCEDDGKRTPLSLTGHSLSFMSNSFAIVPHANWRASGSLAFKACHSGPYVSSSASIPSYS